MKFCGITWNSDPGHLSPARAIDADAATEDGGQSVAGIAIVRPADRRLTAVQYAAHPPAAAQSAAIATRILLGKENCVRGAVGERGRDARRSVPNRQKIRVAGRCVCVGCAAEYLEIARIRGIAGAPVETVAETGIAGALVGWNARLPQPRHARRNHRIPGRPEDADVNIGSRRLVADTTVGVDVDGGIVDVLLFEVG
jgi:hypothetical protein